MSALQRIAFYYFFYTTNIGAIESLSLTQIQYTEPEAADLNPINVEREQQLLYQLHQANSLPLVVPLETAKRKQPRNLPFWHEALVLSFHISHESIVDGIP